MTRKTGFDPRQPRDPHGEWTKTAGYVRRAHLHGVTEMAAAAKRPTRLGIAQEQWARAHGLNTFDPYSWQGTDYVPPAFQTIELKGELLHTLPGTKMLSSKGRANGTGTAADPIDVNGDIDKALRLMSEGKHIRLNQPAELTLVMHKVNQLVADSKGKDKPDWDFSLLSVRGTNLFTAQTKGIPRIAMPQFDGPAQPGTYAEKKAGVSGFADLTDEFAADLREQGVKITDAKVPTAMLRATQSQLVGSKVAGIAAAFLAGNPKVVKMMSEPIFVTRDNYVIDGHHRWAAAMLLDAMDGILGDDSFMNVHIIDMDIGAAIPYAYDFAKRMGISPEEAKAGAPLAGGGKEKQFRKLVNAK
jgi:ParB/Sulfiredoxin domain